MSPSLVFGICAGFQAVVILVDEFYFHRKRGLPAWERLGHPLDTFFVALVFLVFSFLSPAQGTPFWVWGLMVFSTLFITKDEWVHQQFCEASENWLHSLLFVVHPLVFLSAWWLWRETGPNFLHRAQFIGLCAFLVYQTVYWNLFYPDRSLLEKRRQ